MLYEVITSLEGDEIVYHGYQDIGIAVSTDRGLMVPVLRNAERMSLADIERAIRDFAARAREGTITLEELQGGTFSITNGGVFGVITSYSIHYTKLYEPIRPPGRWPEAPICWFSRRQEDGLRPSST